MAEISQAVVDIRCGHYCGKLVEAREDGAVIELASSRTQVLRRWDGAVEVSPLLRTAREGAKVVLVILNRAQAMWVLDPRDRKNFESV